MTYFFFFNDTATTEIYTLSLHDALPICSRRAWRKQRSAGAVERIRHRQLGQSGRDEIVPGPVQGGRRGRRSEEHTSELQSRLHLVCRLLLENKKTSSYNAHTKISASHGR